MASLRSHLCRPAGPPGLPTASRSSRHPWITRPPLPATLLLLLAAPAWDAAADGIPVIDAWFSAQTNCHTVTANVVQTRVLPVLSQPLVSTGKVWIALPDRFRWEMGQPPQTIALRNASTLTLLYPRLKRVEHYPLNDAQPGPWRDLLALLEASFPRSRADLEAQFRILSITQTNRDWQITLQPRNTAAQRLLAEFVVRIHTNDFILAATEMRFADGSRMRTEFSGTTVNTALADDCFEFKTDPSDRVVEPPTP